MPKVLTRYDENFDESTTENESSSPLEIDLLNPRPSENRSRVRGSERFSRFDRATRYFVRRRRRNSTELTNLPAPLRTRCTLAECKNSRFGEISRSDGDTGIPRIIRAIRRHGERPNVKSHVGQSSFGEPRLENSKSSVVVLYDVESNEENNENSTSSSSLSLNQRNVRVSKSEKTLVSVALPSFDSSSFIDNRRDLQTEKLLKNGKATISVETLEANSTNSPISVGGPNYRRRNLTRQRRRSTKSHSRKNGSKRSTRAWHSEERENARQQCRTPDCLSRCLMAHRYACPGQVGTRGECETGNSGIAFLVRHMRNQQRENRQLDDNEREIAEGLDETANGEKRAFPFRSTASGNLKIVPNQVVFESKKVSVLVADPRRTRVNVKAEIGRADTTAVTTENEPSDTLEKLESQQRRAVETAYVPRTRPFGSSRNIRPEDMEENRTTETTHHRLPLPANEVPLSSLGFTGEQPIDWQNIILPEKTDLYRELARRITNYKNADCIVRLGHDEFHCHLLVLQSYSTYFDEKNYKEVDLTGSSVTSKAFGTIYDWMISSTSESCHLLRRDNILEIFVAAQQLGIKELEEQCWAFIDNDELFTEDTAFLLYLEARKIGNTAVMELMVPRIMKFFLMLVGTRDFLELSVEELCLLLRSNYICVNSEMEVLMSAVRWMMHDWQSRRQHMIQVLKCVRFGLIAPWQLVDVKRNPENPEFMELMSYPEVQKMVDDGLAFVIIKYWYGNQTEDYYHWIDLLGLTEPTNRNWAGEDKNYVTYREFLLYLEEYQRTKMPELKSRESSEARSSRREKDGAVGANNLSRKPEAGPPPGFPLSALLGGGAEGGHTGLLPLAASNNFGKPERYTVRPPGTSAIAGQPSASPSPGAAGAPPEILGRYPSGFDRNAKGTTSRNSHERRPNVDDDETTRRSTNVIKDSNRRPWESGVRNVKPTKNPIVIDERADDENYRGYNEAGDSSCKSEEEAATTIQAIYRGYRARSKFHEIRKSCSEERQKTRKIAELLATRDNNFEKPLEPVRLSVSLADRGKNEQQRESKIPRRSPSPRKRRINSSSLADHSGAIKDLDGLRPEAARSVPDELRHHRDTGDSVRTIHRPGMFRDFNEKTSSVSQSDNTDTEADPFSPRPTNEAIRLRNENLPLRISESIIGERGSSGDYRGKDSLFFTNSESVLVFGGLDPHQDYGNGGNTAKDMYRFKSLENEWEYVGEIPEPRHHHSTVYLRGRVYLVGGADPRNENIERKEFVVGSVWSYDPATRAWFAEAELLTPRKNFGLVVSDGMMYAIGGQDENGLALRSVEAYDPLKREWRERRPMNAARIGPAIAKYRELIWVGGGMTTGTKKEPLTREVECYDCLNDRWLRAEPLRSPRCFASMYVIDDCLYVIGGAAKTSSVEAGGITESIESVDVWDRRSRAWRQHGEIGIARHGQAIGSIGDQLLVIGGLTTVYMRSLRSVECYCCRTGKIIKGASSLPHPLSGHGSVSLPAANFLTTI